MRGALVRFLGKPRAALAFPFPPGLPALPAPPCACLRISLVFPQAPAARLKEAPALVRVFPRRLNFTAALFPLGKKARAQAGFHVRALFLLQ